MQVQLKQQEIELAIRGYISAQGINLNGKSVTVAFTAGRKESGLSAEINIDDIDLPDFGEVEEPTLAIVQSITPAIAVVAAPEPLTQPEEVAAAAAEPAEGEVVKTTSLFG